MRGSKQFGQCATVFMWEVSFHVKWEDVAN